MPTGARLASYRCALKLVSPLGPSAPRTSTCCPGVDASASVCARAIDTPRASTLSPARLVRAAQEPAVSDHVVRKLLPARLAAAGHDPARPTFTLWEGVTMYLTREALDATLDAVRDYSAPGSVVAFNYADRALVRLRRGVVDLEHPEPAERGPEA